jgi:hypothetical protein
VVLNIELHLLVDRFYNSAAGRCTKLLNGRQLQAILMITPRKRAFRHLAVKPVAHPNDEGDGMRGYSGSGSVEVVIARPDRNAGILHCIRLHRRAERLRYGSRSMMWKVGTRDPADDFIKRRPI